MMLAPKSLKLVSAADAAYAIHADGKSRSGGVVGFESDTSVILHIYQENNQWWLNRPENRN